MKTIYNELIEISTSKGGDFHHGMILNRRDRACFLISWSTNSETGTYIKGSGSFLCPCCIEVKNMQKVEEKITEIKATEGLQTVYFDLLIKGGYGDETEDSPTEDQFAYGENMVLTHQYARLPICNARGMAGKVYNAMVDSMFEGSFDDTGLIQYHPS